MSAERALWPRLRPWATGLMLLALAAAAAYYTARHWALVRAHHWQLRWPWVLAALLAMAAFFLLQAWAWRQAMTWQGVRVPWRAALWAWSRSALARYLPVPLGMSGSRVYLAVRLGTSPAGAMASHGAELLGTLAAAASLSLLALPLWLPLSPAEAVVAAGLAAFGLVPAGTRGLARLLPRVAPLGHCRLAALAGWSGAYAAAFLAYGMAHVSVLHALGVSSPPPPLVLGASALAWAAGTVNVLSPGGLGTREVVLVSTLQGVLRPPELLALSAVARLVAVGAELGLFFALWALVGCRRLQRVEAA